MRRQRRTDTASAVVLTMAAIALMASSCVPPIEAEGSIDAQDITETTAAPTTTSSTSTTTTTTLPPTTVAITTTTTTTDTTTTTATFTPNEGATVMAVDDVVDGDTITLVDGTSVRLIGIDTPERGECGFAEARDHLVALIGAGPVRLVPGARDDADRYGRLLRYVEVGEIDTNYEMIASGHAIARYDSLDGYGRHPRQDRYRQTDALTEPAVSCLTGISGFAGLAPPSGGETDPRFGTCREAIANGYGSYVRGVDAEYDWYRDADGDGRVCE